jgi:hypothetical protein
MAWYATLAQASQESRRVGGFTFSAATFTPLGNLKTRFGPAAEASLGGYLKTSDNWLWMLEGGYIFSNRVKENSIDNLISPDGQIIGKNGGYADIKIFMRALRLPTLWFGRIIPMPIKNVSTDYSGLAPSIGLGFFQHWIHIQDITQTVYQLEPPYKYGYDRMANGPLISASLAYWFFHKSDPLRGRLAIEYAWAPTQNQRYDYSNNNMPTGIRNDRFFNIKLSWVIAIKQKLGEDSYYF